MIENLRKRYADLQGLLNTPNNQGGGLLGNIPQAAILGSAIYGQGVQGKILGSAIYGQGVQGKDPFAALLPATLQTAQLQKLMTPKASKPFEVINKQTGKPELITNAEYAANPDLYSPAKKTPLMAAGETEEQKEIGKTFGKKFTSINESAESAIKNQSNIATIETLIQQPDLKTGYFGELRTSANKLASEFGLNFDFQNVGAAEVLSSTTGKLVLEVVNWY
jgi:hypothetical protein